MFYTDEFTVSLNGRECGGVRNGDVWESTAPPGHYEVEISFVAEQWGSSLQKASAGCDIADGESVQFECGFPKHFWKGTDLYLNLVKTGPAKTAQEGHVGPNPYGPEAPIAPGFRSRNGVKSEPRVAFAIDGGCSECDSPLLEGAKFCGECGAIMTPPPTMEAGEGCPACGEPAQAGDRFCRKCGLGLSGEPG